MTKRTYHVDDLNDHCAHRIDEELRKQSNGKVHFHEDTRILDAEEDSLSEEAIEKIVLAVVPTAHIHPVKREIHDDYHIQMPREEWENFSFQGHMCSSCAMKIEDDLRAKDDVEDVDMDVFAGKLSLKSTREFSVEELEKIIRRHEDGVTVHRESLPEIWESYVLENLGCQNCALQIELEIEALDGVEEAKVDFVSQTLHVRSTRKLTPQEVEQIARRHESEIHVRRKGAEQKKLQWNDEIKKDVIRLAVGIALFIAAVLSKSGLKLPLYIASYLIAGYPVLLQAGRNLFSGALFDENFLMSIATFGALALKNYPEAVGVMIFYSVGEIFEEMAVHRSRESIKALMDIRPQVAHLKTESGWVDVDPEDVPLGSTILIKPGEMVPIDGIIVEGETVLDLRDITGEPVPQDVGPESRVTSGSMNLSGAVALETTVPYREATVAKILQLVEDSRKTKSPTEKFITKFARIYTPIVVFSAIALAALPPIFLGEPFSKWLSRALIFLIISCPCALVTSVPLSFFGGMGAASKEGILIKGSNHVETLQNLEVALFDKTGTITKGQFHVKEIIGDSLPEEELLRLAAIGEQHSNHPIAISIVSRYGKGNLPEPGNLKETVAGGVDYFVDGIHYFLGNARFLKAQGLTFRRLMSRVRWFIWLRRSGWAVLSGRRNKRRASPALRHCKIWASAA